MKFYWNCNTHGRPEKNQPLYCAGLYGEFMELSMIEAEKLDDEVVLTFISLNDNIVGVYETPNHRFYGDLDKNTNTFVEFLKED